MNPVSTIRQPWLTLARLAWVVLAAYNALPGLLGVPAYYQQFLALDLWPNNWGWTQAALASAVARAGLSPQAMAYIMILPALLEVLIFFSVGMLIFWRKSDEWQGLLVSFVLVGLCGTFAGDRFQNSILSALPPTWQTVAYEVGILIWLAFFLFLAIFPDGRFDPPWMRWVGLALLPWWLATELTRLILGQTPDFLMWIGLVILGLIIVGKMVRYRQGSPIERQQMRWFLYALIVFCAYSVSSSIYMQLFPLPPQPGPRELAGYMVDRYLSDLTFILIPLAIAIAIFRYRLWDIDLVIRRTLQYGALTFLLGLVYFGGVTLLQGIFSTGQQSPLAVVLSTLAVAALFTPLRRRIQSFIDRRFYRQKYNAEQILDGFTAGLQNEVDGEALHHRLMETVSETMQPESLGLWVRKG